MNDIDGCFDAMYTNYNLPISLIFCPMMTFTTPQKFGKNTLQYNFGNLIYGIINLFVIFICMKACHIANVFMLRICRKWVNSSNSSRITFYAFWIVCLFEILILNSVFSNKIAKNKNSWAFLLCIKKSENKRRRTRNRINKNV